MPQGRKKVPFSTKQKKKQLQHRREQKQGENKSYGRQALAYSNLLKDATQEKESTDFSKAVVNSGSSSRYQLKFHAASKKAYNEAASDPISLLPKHALELGFSEGIAEDLGMPVRPPWSFNMSKQQLDGQENKYFRKFVESIEKRDDFEKIGLFELNLETWRQLWRVLEMSDVILLITDIRHPTIHFPLALYKHVTEQLQRKVILVLNKVDLAPPSAAVAWREYFKAKYPELEVIFFSSLPRKVKNKRVDPNFEARKSMIKHNLEKLLAICQKLAGENVDLSSWRKKIESDASNSFMETEKINVEIIKPSNDDYRCISDTKFKDGILTLGCIGFPNVGKSSLLNTLMGKKVVSVSRTPGHTKYFQTIFLTPTVKLCDCPGLVFPCYVSKALQVLSGSCPISQLRDPYPSIKFIAERLDLLETMKIKVKDDDGVELTAQITALDICQAWAIKRGFYTAKAARPDVYRAANNLLRLALSGHISLCFFPPGYFDNEDMWRDHPEVTQFFQVGDRDSSFESDDDQGDNQSSDDYDSSEQDSGLPKVNVNIFSYLECDD